MGEDNSEIIRCSVIWNGSILLGFFCWNREKGCGEMKNSLFLLVLLFSSGVVLAGDPVYYVDNDGPADYSSIQDAINSSNDSDTIIVKPGTYQENIRFNGKKIILTSLNPNDPTTVESTIIDGGHNDSVVTFYRDETADTVITGFTITNGSSQYGGGIYCWQGESPTVSNCRIINNESVYTGGGIYNCDGDILNCTISGNIGGGGNGLSLCDGTIKNCSITNNTSTIASSGGGLIWCHGEIIDCLIAENVIGDWGGGLHDCDGLIQGCEIKGNYAGGGISHSEALVKDCIISDNIADGWGGGALDGGNGTTLVNCQISNNIGIPHGGAITGGLVNITNCTFEGNYAEKGGAIMDLRGSVTNCDFINNSAGHIGTILVMGGTHLKNCTIAGNKANDYAAIVVAHTESGYQTPIIESCTIVNNVGNESGGIHFFESSDPDVIIKNNIITNNVGTGIFWKYTADKDLSYNNVWGNTGGNYGGWASPGEGSISANPLFVDNGYWDPNNTPDDSSDDLWVNGDYHLKSEAGRWESNNDTWMKNDITSPCVDAGDPLSDWGLELYPHGMRLNMGAYGGTVEASLSSSLAGNVADFNNDNIVNYIDYSLLIGRWLTTEQPLREDIDRNGIVDFEDLVVFAEEWLNRTYVLIVSDQLDVDPGWTTDGQWEYGQPLGGGSVEQGNPDPSEGYTGSDVYGVNLSGDYITDISGPYYLTAGPFDCSDYENIKLRFARWLNSDTPDYARSTVEASNDGTNWTIIWEHQEPSEITDNQWQIIDYELGSLADSQPTVYLRWGYEVHADRAYPYSGWNIDDVELWGTP